MDAYYDREFDELLTNIRYEYNRVCKERDAYRKTVATFNKDDEVQKAKQEVERCKTHSLQMLTNTELRNIEAFKEKHHRSCKNGSTFCYELSGTGVGTSVVISCPTCGEKEDVTDYFAW